MINKKTYKRLTANGEKINIHANLQLAQIYNRLAELEDKIMDGTLMELPCKVGDKFYEIDTIYCEYYEHEVGGFSFENDKLIIIDCFDSRYKASEVCFSEAEAQLKELQENKK